MAIATVEAEPCTICETTGGHANFGQRKAARIKGLCRSCYNRRLQADKAPSEYDTPWIPTPRELYERAARVRVAGRRKAMKDGMTGLDERELREVLP